MSPKLSIFRHVIEKICFRHEARRVAICQEANVPVFANVMTSGALFLCQCVYLSYDFFKMFSTRDNIHLLFCLQKNEDKELETKHKVMISKEYVSNSLTLGKGFLHQSFAILSIVILYTSQMLILCNIYNMFDIYFTVIFLNDDIMILPSCISVALRS